LREPKFSLLLFASNRRQNFKDTVLDGNRRIETGHQT
jgi:hypothetical protein